jgi:hypothetical protein
MVKSMEITKVSIRNRLVVDAEVRMSDPKDYDFSPRADIDGSTLSLRNEGDEGAVTSIDLDIEQLNTAERDRTLVALVAKTQRAAINVGSWGEIVVLGIAHPDLCIDDESVADGDLGYLHRLDHEAPSLLSSKPFARRHAGLIRQSR